MSSAVHILHADLDSFYASVEQRDDPRLRGRPVIVGGGVVLAASYEAKALRRADRDGRRAGAPAVPGRGRRPPRMAAYSEASKAVFEVFEDTTPLVEGMSIDEAFLDVRGLRAHRRARRREIAVRLRRGCASEVGLPITVGVARTKFLAKVASAPRQARRAARGAPGRRARVPAPAARRAAVGRRAGHGGKLHERGITTVGQVAAARRGALVAIVGRAAGRHLHALAHNRDPRPVQGRSRRRSMGAQHALGAGAGRRGARRRPRRARRPHGTAPARGAARVPHGRPAPALRATSRARPARTRSPRRPRSTRSRSWPLRGRCSAPACRSIECKGITLLGITLTNLERRRPTSSSRSPFERRRRAGRDDRQRPRPLRHDAITRAVLLGRDQGVAVPLLPD